MKQKRTTAVMTKSDGLSRSNSTTLSPAQIKELEIYFRSNAGEAPSEIRHIVDAKFGGFSLDYLNLAKSKYPKLEALATTHQIHHVDSSLQAGKLVKVKLENLPRGATTAFVRVTAKLGEEYFLLVFLPAGEVFLILAPQSCEGLTSNEYGSVRTL